MRLVTSKLKYSSLVKTLKRVPAEIRRNGESILRQEGRSFAKELARQTLPIGLTDSAWKKSAFKIAGDIRRAVVSPARLYAMLEQKVSKSFAEEVYAVMQGKDKKRNRTLAKLLSTAPAPIAGLMLSSSVPAEVVKAARTGAWGNVPSKETGRAIVTKEEAIARFIKKMQRRIGMAKAGWAAAGFSISGRAVSGMPAWAGVGRHGTELGQGVYLKERNRIRLINFVRHARQALPENLEQRARNQAARNLHLSLLRAVNAMMAKEFRSSKGQRLAA
jgi:hypothetical protein